MRLSINFLFGVNLLLLATSFFSCSGPDFQVKKILVNWQEEPKAIEKDAIHFGWEIDANQQTFEQSAYNIQISNSKGEIVWDSQKVVSDQSQLVSYTGPQLKDGAAYSLQLKVWNKKDKAVSASTQFGIALGESQMKANWIGAIRREDAHLPEGRHWHSPSLKKNKAFYDSIPELAKRSIILRKEWAPKQKIEQAKIFISGLGHYQLSLNGEKVWKSEFAPLWTDYDKTVLYNTYDVTSSLADSNAIGVLLGNGFYNVIGDRYRKLWVSFGPPTLFFQMNVVYEDGSEEWIYSDETWKYDKSPITFNDIFGGEDYDARLEQEGWDLAGFDDSDWKDAIIQDAPKGKLQAQSAPEVRIQQQFDIAKSNSINDSVFVFDMGQNLSGFPSIKVKGKAGQKIRFTVGERIDDEGLVNQKNTGKPYFFEYTLRGEGIEEWHPRFSFYGYQYIQVDGAKYKDSGRADLPELIDLKSDFVYSNAQPVGEFSCSNEIFSKTHTLINNAVKSNMQAVFTDCPHREKLGWLEELHLVGPGLLYNYDLTGLFAKEMQDMEDAQRTNGLIPNIAPEYVDFSQMSWGADFTDSPEWGTAALMLPWYYYEYYGDATLLKEYYPVMKGFVDYLTSRSERYIVSHGLGDWYDYGEHRAGYGKNSPIEVSATSHYYLCAEKLADAAEFLGYTADATAYSALTDSIRSNFNRAFFDPETNQYGTGSQFCNAVAIQMGIVAEQNKSAVLDNLIADIKAHGNRLTTGDVGNRYLFLALAENDLNDLLFEMLNHYDAPGYGYQLQYGLTTLTEQWDPKNGNSWNHFMMGQIEEWFFKSIFGINADQEKPGFKHFFFTPQLIGDLDWAKGSYHSVYGKVAIDWSIENGVAKFRLEVPANTSATFIVPDQLEKAGDQLELKSGVHQLSFNLK